MDDVATSCRSHLSRRLGAIVTTAMVTVLLMFIGSVPAGAVEGADHAEVLVGEVTVESLPDVGIVVVLNQFDAQEPDATAERVFVLQTATPMEAELPIHMGAARTIFRQDRLLVVSLEEPLAVGLFLSDVGRSDVESAVRELLNHRYGRAASATVLLHAGYGLSNHWGEFALPLESWPPVREHRGLARKDFEEQIQLCHAGGAGATQCSISCVVGGCSVTCETGTYACCTCTWTPECKCIPSGGSQCPPLPCVP